MKIQMWVLVALAATVGSAAGQAISRLDGVDDATKIAYALITVEGKLADSAAKQPSSPPRLTAQCTRDAKGKMRFELLMDLGGGEPLAFYPPWQKTKDSLYPPILPKANVTMEFIGYKKEKPVKRQWSYLKQPQGELMYSAPGMSSSNMEEIMYYNQFLKALPTFKLAVPDKPVVVFETLAWQAKVRAEPLCWAGAF